MTVPVDVVQCYSRARYSVVMHDKQTNGQSELYFHTIYFKISVFITPTNTVPLILPIHLHVSAVSLGYQVESQVHKLKSMLR